MYTFLILNHLLRFIVSGKKVGRSVTQVTTLKSQTGVMTSIPGYPTPVYDTLTQSVKRDWKTYMYIEKSEI